jgi:hypothetical protein
VCPALAICAEVALAHAADADARDVEPAVGAGAAPLREDVAGSTEIDAAVARKRRREVFAVMALSLISEASIRAQPSPSCTERSFFCIFSP